jgi:ribosome-associated translation inhibitor RaiA
VKVEEKVRKYVKEKVSKCERRQITDREEIVDVVVDDDEVKEGES